MVDWSRRLSEIALPKTTRWFELTWRHKLWRLQQLGWIMQDVIGTARQPEHDHRTHLRGTLEWLCRAHDAGRRSAHPGCLARGWAFELGWLPESVDDTGWLIETFLPAANIWTGPPSTIGHAICSMHCSISQTALPWGVYTA